MERSFNIRALEALVTPEIVKVAIAEAKAEVVAKQEEEVAAEEGTTAEAVVGGEIAAKGVAPIEKII